MIMKNIFAYILGIGLLFVSCERDPDFALTNILVEELIVLSLMNKEKVAQLKSLTMQNPGY